MRARLTAQKTAAENRSHANNKRDVRIVACEKKYVAHCGAAIRVGRNRFMRVHPSVMREAGNQAFAHNDAYGD